MITMAFRFETAHDRWKWYKQSENQSPYSFGYDEGRGYDVLGPDDIPMSDEEIDAATEYEYPEQSMAKIRQRLHEGATMEEIKQEFAKFIAENNLSDNDLYGIGAS